MKERQKSVAGSDLSIILKRYNLNDEVFSFLQRPYFKEVVWTLRKAIKKDGPLGRRKSGYLGIFYA